VLFRGQAGAKIGFMFEKRTEYRTPNAEIRDQRTKIRDDRKNEKHPPSLGYGAASEWRMKGVWRGR
jgi:hypothetical protein